MGEKGNAASVAPSQSSGVMDAVSAAGGAAMGGGAAVATDVVVEAKDRLVEVVVDHAIDEGRERLHRGDDADGTDGESASAANDDESPGV